MKRSAPVLAAGAAALVAASLAIPLSSCGPGPGAPRDLWIHPFPPGVDPSPDFEIFVSVGGEERQSFGHYSFMRSAYEWFPRDRHDRGEIADMARRLRTQTSSLTWTSFSFAGGPATLRLRVLPGAAHLTLPLEDCRVLPSSYAIPCRVEGRDTMIVRLDRPRKIAVVPGYGAAMQPYRELARVHAPFDSFLRARERFRPTPLPILEGFRSPLLIFARGPERNRPDRSSRSTLVIRPGQRIPQSRLRRHAVLWFSPGTHDWSGMNEPPGHYTLLEPGQVVYLEGGAILRARLRAARPGARPRVRGRGALSGIGLRWLKPNVRYAMLLGCDAEGITVVDRPTAGAAEFGVVRDVAFAGAWHANTDGVALRDGLIEDSFLMAGDDNLKLHGGGRARGLVLWQADNAHPIMLRANEDGDYAGTVVEDVDVVMFQTRVRRDPWHLASPGAIAAVRTGDSLVSDFTFRDIRIESPYLSRAIALFNVDSHRFEAPWLNETTPESHTRLRNFRFEDVRVQSPVIFLKSLVRSDYPGSLEGVTFRNLVINGVRVDERNKSDYFEVPFVNARDVRFE